MNSQYDMPYTPPTLTVDAVIFELVEGALHVLLIRRPDEPFKEFYALPGGYNPKGETTHQALKRIVAAKTGLDVETDLLHIEQLYTFDTVGRDPRGHAVSVTYMGCGRDIKIRSTSFEAAFYPVDNLPELAYDHDEIVAYAHKRLITRLTHTNAVAAFMPDEFTLSDLQRAYEGIFNQTFDKRNFRKKFLSLGLIHDTTTKRRDGAHRPAQLYQFNSLKLESLTRSFGR